MPTTGLQPLSACTQQTAGQDWDAIRTPKSVGLAAMAILGPRCGAVVEDSSGAIVYFFVPCGAAASWSVEHAQVVADGDTLTIPPARRTQGPGPHWRMCPGEGRMLTEPEALAAAIEDAFGPRVGHEQTG